MRRKSSMRFRSCSDKLLKTAKEKRPPAAKQELRREVLPLREKHGRAALPMCSWKRLHRRFIRLVRSSASPIPFSGASFHFLFHLVHVWNLVIASGVTCGPVTFAKACFHHPQFNRGYPAYSAHKVTCCKTRIAAGGFVIARKARTCGAACVQPEAPAAAVHPDSPFSRFGNSLKICSFITPG